MKKLSMALAIGVLGLAGVASEAVAHDSLGFSISFGGPVYYDPPPVYYAEPPVVYYRPAPIVYYRPAPVYYGPSAFISFGNNHWNHHGHRDHDFNRGWQGRHDR